MYLICSDFVCGKTHCGQTQNEHKVVEVNVGYDKTGYYLTLTKGKQ